MLKEYLKEKILLSLQMLLIIPNFLMFMLVKERFYRLMKLNPINGLKQKM